MRICIVGKFPPIEGGVSSRTYWEAHSLAESGHEVQVVTNATEVEATYRMFMTPEDWARCEGTYPGGGCVRVHRTDPGDGKQQHIPSHNPFVTKLASQAAIVVQRSNLDVIYSFYMEPYGVAAHLASKMADRPHVVRMAGSDSGRLWNQRQFTPLYDYIFRN